jgi:hypothetical protein
MGGDRSSGEPGLDPDPRARHLERVLRQYIRHHNHHRPPPSDGPSSSGRSRRSTTPARTTSERDPKTADPWRPHQRVRSRLMIEFLHPTPHSGFRPSDSRRSDWRPALPKPQVTRVIGFSDPHTFVASTAHHGQHIRAAIESMSGVRFVHDTLELAGWDVDIADAYNVKGMARLACKTTASTRGSCPSSPDGTWCRRSAPHPACGPSGNGPDSACTWSVCTASRNESRLLGAICLAYQAWKCLADRARRRGTPVLMLCPQTL